MPKRSSTKTRAKKSTAAKSRRNQSTAQIARLLEVDPATVLRWCGEGLPFFKSPSRKAGNLYDADEVRAWMKTTGRTGDVGRPAEEGTEEFAVWHTRKEKALASQTRTGK